MLQPIPSDDVQPTGTSPDDQPVADLSSAPLPTARTLRHRRSLPRQALRFVAFNSRIIRMVLRGHQAGPAGGH